MSLKKPLTLFLVLFLFSSYLTPTYAAPTQKSLVIIDTGFDTSLQPIKDAVIFESCIMSWAMCPNGQYFQEGTGSAALPANLLNSGNVSHGTQMASIALNTYPGQKVVLIRLIAYNSRGDRLPVYESTVVQAFKWILSKREEFNIGAIAMAQGHHPVLTGKNYCPKSAELEKIVLDLKIKNVGVFFPAGNASDKSRIDWPACIPAALAIGAMDSKGQIANYSNYDRNLIDFYTPGNAQALLPGGSQTSAVGTSVSVLIAASYWLTVANLKPDLPAPSISQLFRDSGQIIFDSKFRFGRQMQLEEVLKALP